jgi:ATP-dependent Clp protease adaptor protein ClpS
MELKPSKESRLDILEKEDVKVSLSCKVILYNDDWHTFDEVIFQLIKALGCTYEKARACAFEVHVKGSCVVFNGDMKECLKVSSVLEEIALNTQIIT